MRNTITFADGTEFSPINVLRYTENIRGADRTVLEVVLDGSQYNYEDVERLYSNSSNFTSVVIKEFYDNDEGNEDESEFIYNNFDIPVSISKTRIGDYTTITLKVSQKTVSELQQEKLIQDNQDTQMALIELAAQVAALSPTEEG